MAGRRRWFAALKPTALQREAHLSQLPQSVAETRLRFSRQIIQIKGVQVTLVTALDPADASNSDCGDSNNEPGISKTPTSISSKSASIRIPVSLSIKNVQK